MHTYHILKDGVPMEVTPEELRALEESGGSVECDIKWYLSHGGITHNDFKAGHPI